MTKNAKTINKKILAVSDSADELNDIQHLLAEDFGSHLKADSEVEGLRLFYEEHPSVLILAFQNIEKAEHFYLSLYRHDNQIVTIPHQTLLLCVGNESRKAYQLCKGGSFDDYVADRPLYDPYSLCLSVMQAFKRHDQEQHSYLLNNQIKKTTTGLHQFGEFISKKLASGDGQHREAIRIFRTFTHKLASDIENLEENLVANTAGLVSKKMYKEKLNHQFEHFRNDSLQNGSQNVMEQLDKTNNWLEELDNGCKDYVEAAQKENDVIQSNQIMLVDDDDFYRDTLATILQEAGLDVLGTGDGRTALTKLQHSRPKLILLDYKMPGMNGIETLKQIKSNPDTKSIPVIMLTGEHTDELVRECSHMGATDFIAKPSNRDVILSKIDAALNVL